MVHMPADDAACKHSLTHGGTRHAAKPTPVSNSICISKDGSTDRHGLTPEWFDARSRRLLERVDVEDIKSCENHNKRRKREHDVYEWLSYLMECRLCAAGGWDNM